jgi:predicted lysophospholipase L1 biosynthesis ABC-type transport system permease subunit
VHDEMLTGNMGWMGKVLVRVHPDASLDAVSAGLQRAIDAAPSLQKISPEMRARLGRRPVVDVALAPLRHAYFDTEVTGSFNAGIGQRGNPALVAGLAAMAALILALAAINYVNLASVRVLRRQREVAMRKVLGAGVRQLVLQLLAESMLVALLAVAIGLLLAWLAMPLFAAPVILNAIAARELGFASAAAALGQTLQLTNYEGKIVLKQVVGIAPELRFLSLREAPRPMAYELGTGGATLSVRGHGAPAQVEALVQGLWPRYFPDTLLRMYRASDILAANYADDARMVKLLAIATAIALAIAAFGTYVLSAHTVQRRAKEIVMRKLHGARQTDIALLVVREIGSLTLVAAVLGLPLAALGIARYLAGYVEHAPIGYWTLLFALASTLGVALMAAARHAWVASRMRPADALRR